jgi:Ca2+-binding EF-hand superfamily protein
MFTPTASVLSSLCCVHLLCDSLEYSIHYLDDSTIAKMLKATPTRSKGSKRLFRDMWDNGLLSYGDYLFLLSTLTKPKSQFEIAFKLMDKDGSDYIDKNEFQLMRDSVATQRKLPWLSQGRLEETSLVRHFFGAKGRDKLYSKDFFKFIEDFQTEVREIEFYRHSKGMPAITEEDFASILLKHTSTKMSEVHQRLQERKAPDCKGITFDQFNTFCQLLDNLDDFSTALAIHNLSGLPVTQDEFKRAAYISVGQQLDPAIVMAVFAIFDVDGDGKLSYTEFIQVMKSWSKRSSLLHEGKKEGPWQQFKTCVGLEMTKK